MEEIDAIDGDGGIDLALAMWFLNKSRNRGSTEGDSSVHNSETGLAILDPDLVRVNSSENHSNVEGKGSHRSSGSVGSGNAHVLDADLLEIKLRLLGLEGEDDDEDDGEDEEGEEGEEEEEAAAAALEGGGGEGGGSGAVGRVVAVGGG